MVNKRDSKKIYLSFVREGDAFSIQDQDGRKVAGLKGAELKFQHDELAEIHLRVLDCTVAHDEETWHIGRARPTEHCAFHPCTKPRVHPWIYCQEHQERTHQ